MLFRRFYIIEEREIIPFEIKCFVISHSHRLNKEAFSPLMGGTAHFVLSDVRENSFMLTDINKSIKCREVKHFIEMSHVDISAFIMALNIATLGYFTWDWYGLSVPRYKLTVPNGKKGATIFPLQMISRKEDFPENIEDITEKDVLNTCKIYGALAKEEKNSKIREEYIKGILHLSLTFFDIDFCREAFYNFYRCFENIVTIKVLKVRKLNKETKDFEDAIKKIGLGEKFVEFFNKSLYIIRSNQVMHAQKKQVNINIDDVVAIKMYIDVLLHKVYEPIIKKALENFRAQRE